MSVPALILDRCGPRRGVHTARQEKPARRRPLALWMGLGLVLLLALPMAQAKKTSEGKPLDLDAVARTLASKLRKAAIPGEVLPAIPDALRYQHPSGQRLPGKRGIVQLFVQCDGPRCTPRITHAVDGDTGIEVQGRAELPAIRKDSTQFEFLPLAITDLDKDGQEELLVRYAITAPGREGKGSVFAHMLAIVNLPDLSLALVHEIKSGGQAGIDDLCTHQLTPMALDSDKRLDLRWVRTCECADKSTCFAGPAPPEDFLASAERRFVRRPVAAQ
jgi:hypothetical protein